MTKITVLEPEPEHRPRNMCKKCGANMFAPVVLTTAQYASLGAGYSVALVCINCKSIIEMSEKKG
jgi:hypothetical protein